MSSAFDPLEKPSILRSLPFTSVHLCCLLAFVSGVSPAALGLCLAMYLLRMFAITAGYHRYFSHRSYKTSRWFQFVLAYLGASSAQMGPLWWAAHHRHHHKHSDTDNDIHSPTLRGLWWAHVGWILCDKYVPTNEKEVPDLVKYPELSWLDRNHLVAPITLALATYGAGLGVEHFWPELQTTAFQFLIWGFFVSTVLLYHGTFAINSLTHVFGTRRFKTGDDSRNNLWLALITLGEGWHNNHHRYPGSERQGFYWWEIDITHYVLKALSWLGIVWDLRVPPARIYAEAKGETH